MNRMIFKPNRSTHARGYLIEIQQTLARTTIRNHFSGLRTFFKFLLSRQLIQTNPFQNLTLPKLDKKLPLFLTEKQALALIAQTDSTVQDSPQLLSPTERSNDYSSPLWRRLTSQ